MDQTTHPITQLRNRLDRIGIQVTFMSNWPWIYLDRVNGLRVKERFQANHGFTVAFHQAAATDTGIRFTDIREIFKTIRQYVEKSKDLERIREKEEKEGQRRLGYVVYEIHTYLSSQDRGQTWDRWSPSPGVHWKKRIYLNLESAQDAVDHMKQSDPFRSGVIVPVYADRSDLEWVQKGWQEMKNRIAELNQGENEQES